MEDYTHSGVYAWVIIADDSFQYFFYYLVTGNMFKQLIKYECVW